MVDLLSFKGSRLRVRGNKTLIGSLVSAQAAILIVVVLFVSGALSSQAQLTEKTRDIGRTLNQDCVVCIYGEILGTDSVKIGVGFFVNEKGYVVTAKHVIQRVKRIYVKQVCDSKVARLDTATFVDSSSKHDIAIVRIEPKLISHLQCYPVTFADDTTLVLGGMDVEIQGWDCVSQENFWIVGTISVIFGEDSMKVQGYPITRQMSGAPVFFRGTQILSGFVNRGRLTSMQIGSHIVEFPMVFPPYEVVSGKVVKELLKKNRIPYTESYYDAQPAPARPREGR